MLISTVVLSCALTVRPLAASDFLSAAQLLRRTFAQDANPVSGMAIVAEHVMTLKERSTANLQLVAFDDDESGSGNPIGFVEVYTPEFLLSSLARPYPPEMRKKLKPYVASLAVEPSARRRGVGRALMREVEARIADGPPPHVLSLEVEVENSAATRLYEDMGYRLVGRNEGWRLDGDMLFGKSVKVEKLSFEKALVGGDEPENAPPTRVEGGSRVVFGRSPASASASARTAPPSMMAFVGGGGGGAGSTGGEPKKEWEQPGDFQLPEDLMGPWELQCTMPGMGSMWVELHESGECSCSSRVGKGRRWSAVPKGKTPGEAWLVRFVLLDKLSRQMRWSGEVRRDELKGLVISGEVLGPPRLGASKEEVASGVVVGEFGGFQLPN